MNCLELRSVSVKSTHLFVGDLISRRKIEIFLVSEGTFECMKKLILSFYFTLKEAYRPAERKYDNERS